MNPSTAFGLAFCDELARCGLREVVLAPGSRSTPLAMAFEDLERRGRLRLHVRIDERSASFTALGLAKASRRPVAVLCTSGTAAANFHPAVIEADESGVPLLVLTADRPPELTGYRRQPGHRPDQAVRQRGALVLRGRRARTARRSGRVLALGGLPGVGARRGQRRRLHRTGPPQPGLPRSAYPRPDRGSGLAGRPGRASGRDAVDALRAARHAPGQLELPWTERGVVVCGDGDYDATALVALAEQAGWPVLAEPSSGARRGPNALPAYQYLLGTPEFTAAHRPDVLYRPGGRA